MMRNWIKCSVLTLILVACGPTEPSWRTTQEGVNVYTLRRGGRLTWTGKNNEASQADGPGHLVHIVDDFVIGTYDASILSGEMKNGKFEGDVLHEIRDSFALGDYNKTIWAYREGKPGEKRRPTKAEISGYKHVRSRYLAEQKTKQAEAARLAQAEAAARQPASGGGGSSLSDTDLIGGLFALGGAAMGDAGVTLGGISMLQGNTSEALSHLGGSTSQGGLTATAAGMAATGNDNPATPQKKPANKLNLIDQYGLRKFENSDHMSYYVRQADAAFSSYKKSGEEQYYKEHEAAADTARQFHKQTYNTGGGFARPTR